MANVFPSGISILTSEAIDTLYLTASARKANRSTWAGTIIPTTRRRQKPYVQAQPELLFPGNLGGTRLVRSYMSENWLRCKLWFPLIEKAEIRRLDLHAARHTFASRLIANGENLQYIAGQLGHSSINVTADTYGHLIPGGNRQAVDRLDKVSDLGDLKPNRDVSSLAEAKSLVL